MEDLHVPIALRRTPRRAPRGDHPAAAVVRDSSVPVARTPTRRAASRKRVRFSDPGPGQGDAASTGLTPTVRRTSLGPTPSPKRKRPSALYRTDDADIFGTPSGGTEIRIPSLRQALDDRVKRRIRRNGLSEEMNTIEDEKKQRARANEAEMERLRRELAERDHEIERLRDATVFQDTGRIVELEQQVEELRSELRSRSESAAPAPPSCDWARHPFEDGDRDGGDNGYDEFGDTTMRDLVCSTPPREARTSLAASQSFPSPPCTSPTIPASPCFARPFTPPPPPALADAAAQADLPDPERAVAEAELGSLRRELGKLTAALESHEASRARLAARLAAAPGGPSAPEPDGGVEASVDRVLQSLADKTEALSEIGSSLINLGFAGRDAGEVLASLVSEFRAARLELEYLTPGEVPLPLDSHGAEVLDLVLTRLRGLARKVREQGDAIEEGHALELSLRQQLAARVQAMDGLKRELQRELGRKAARLQEKDGRIAELELAMDRLHGAVEGYRRDVAALEGRMRQADETNQQTEDRAQQAEADAAQRADAIRALQEQLAAVGPPAAELRATLAAVHARRQLEIKTLNGYHGKALAQRDARVAELRKELDAVHESLRAAHASVCQLRVQNAALEADRAADRRAAAAALETMKAELERLLALEGAQKTTAAPPTGHGGQDDDGSAASPRRSSARLRGAAPGAGPGAGGFLAGGLTRRASRRKKRRHDSGLGFVGEEELGC